MKYRSRMQMLVDVLQYLKEKGPTVTSKAMGANGVSWQQWPDVLGTLATKGLISQEKEGHRTILKITPSGAQAIKDFFETKNTIMGADAK